MKHGQIVLRVQLVVEHVVAGAHNVDHVDFGVVNHVVRIERRGIVFEKARCVFATR